MATITLSEVSKSFGSLDVLRNLSLAAADGETVVIFGPSGSGKTLILRLIAGIYEPDRGAILVDGQDLVGVDPEDRGIGMAFQNFALFPHMSAYENIASPLRARRTGADGVKSGVDKIATLLKIDHVLGHAPRELSNGQKQRTALARALVAAPKILLLDDPLRNVDAKLRFEMRLELPRLLRRFGSTVLYVTQDYKEAMALADRIAVLISGRFVQVDAPEEVYRRPATTEVARLFGDPTINLLDGNPRRERLRADRDARGLKIALEAAYPGRDRGGAVLGIRPEAVRFCEPGAPNAVPVTVSAVTPLNERIVTLLVAADGREILASRPAGTAGPPADSRRMCASIRARSSSSTAMAAPACRLPEREHVHPQAPPRARKQDLPLARQGAGARREGDDDRHRARRDRRAARLVGLRQDLHAQDDRRLRGGDERRDHALRPDHSHAAALGTWRRNGIRGLLALPPAHRAREHRLRAEIGTARPVGIGCARRRDGEAPGDRGHPRPLSVFHLRRPAAAGEPRPGVGTLGRSAISLTSPWGQLEPQLRAILRGRIKHFLRERRMTSVLVTHDQTEANALADRIAVMEDGVLQQYATPLELKSGLPTSSSAPLSASRR
jgi:multiple sugar transport system ATP-binding protein